MRYTFVITVTVILMVTVKFTSSISVEKDLSMTLREKHTLDKFRERVTPLFKEKVTDIYLIRWLRAKSFNLDAAEALLKENLRWRKENNIDNILTENFDDIAQGYHATMDTYDKTGRPIGVIDITDWDIRGAVLQGRGKRLLHYMNYLMENVTAQVSERQGKGMSVTQWKVLANANGFNMVTHGCPLCIPLWLQFVNNLENHYPGWMDELITIDSPSAVNLIVQILRPVLSKQTREALTILPPNKSKWMAYLDERISRSERRPAYGGIKPPVIYN